MVEQPLTLPGSAKYHRPRVEGQLNAESKNSKLMKGCLSNHGVLLELINKPGRMNYLLSNSEMVFILKITTTTKTERMLATGVPGNKKKFHCSCRERGSGN